MTRKPAPMRFAEQVAFTIFIAGVVLAGLVMRIFGEAEPRSTKPKPAGHHASCSCVDCEAAA